MIDWLTAQGWTVEIKPGRVYLTKGKTTGDYSTLKAAFFAVGGPAWSYTANPMRLKP